MTLLEYIRDYYDVTDKIRSRFKNPVQRILEADILPCDDVRAVEGELHKVAYIDDDEENFVTVLSLMSLQEADIEKLNDPGLTRVWKNYLEYIDTSSIEVQELLAQAKLFAAKRAARKGEIQHLLHN